MELVAASVEGTSERQACSRQRQLDALKGLLAVYEELLEVREGVRTGRFYDYSPGALTAEEWIAGIRDRYTRRAMSARRALVASGFREGLPPMAWLTAETELPCLIERPTHFMGLWRIQFWSLVPEKADCVKTIIREIKAEIMLMEYAPGAVAVERSSPLPEARCPARRKTELAARILDRRGKDVRTREVRTKLSECQLRDEGNGKYSIVLDPQVLSAGEIERLTMSDWPPPPGLR